MSQSYVSVNIPFFEDPTHLECYLWSRGGDPPIYLVVSKRTRHSWPYGKRIEYVCKEFVASNEMPYWWNTYSKASWAVDWDHSSGESIREFVLEKIRKI